MTYFNDGHYQRAWPFGTRKVGIAFDQHPKGKGLNWRTDLYYMESDDYGQTWKNVQGETLALPLAPDRRLGEGAAAVQPRRRDLRVGDARRRLAPSRHLVLPLAKARER